MIIALAESPEKKTVFLGITKENVDRMAKNQPILKDLAQIGLPGLAVVILYGETEEELVADLTALGGVDANTKVEDH